ncbi:hypothetical protein PCE1_001289 [Barthelona sp. PCE]
MAQLFNDREYDFLCQVSDLKQNEEKLTQLFEKNPVLVRYLLKSLEKYSFKFPNTLTPEEKDLVLQDRTKKIVEHDAMQAITEDDTMDVLNDLSEDDIQALLALTKEEVAELDEEQQNLVSEVIRRYGK